MCPTANICVLRFELVYGGLCGGLLRCVFWVYFGMSMLS